MSAAHTESSGSNRMSIGQKKTTILVADPNPWGEAVTKNLAARGFDVNRAFSATDAFDIVKSKAPKFAIMELELGEFSAIDLIPQFLSIHNSLRVVIVTHRASPSAATAAIKSGACNFITKPVSVDFILASVGAIPTIHIPECILHMRLECAKQAYLSEILANCKSITKSAQALGLDRRSLRRMMDRYSLKPGAEHLNFSCPSIAHSSGYPDAETMVSTPLGLSYR